MIDYARIDKKWQEEWANAKIFESEPDGRKSYMVTAAFPYVNTPLHIGHIRTYGTADILARYKRMQGYNVLFPMGFHATGTPILAFSKRIAKKDESLIHELETFHIPQEEIAKMTDPEYIASYFVKHVEEGMRKGGLSIDWRRKFVSIEPFFSKFVEWQFGILNKKGYLVKGKHPVGWCPNEKGAVGMHDTKHDVEPEIEEEVAIKFKVDGEDASLICSTYRPETVDGVTNIFVKPEARYVMCKIEGQSYYIARAAASVLNYQTNIEIISEIEGNELLKKRCINPFNGEKVPIFPGYFVKEALGTGVVMSVPAHAPFDYAALERLKASGYDMQGIKYKKIIDVQIGRSLSDVSVGESTPIHLDIPALAYLEVLHTDVNAINDMLEFATKLQYREESHWGKMLVKGYEGMSEPEARDRIKKKLLDEKNAMMIYIIQNAPVHCRCGYDVVVKVMDDQWFLNYGDEKWKAQVKDWFKDMRILPDKVNNGFNAAIDWINLRAVARSQGLGTKFPLDKNFIIESLSDSTIYMSFYTILHLIRGVPVEKLTPEFFDFVYLGKGETEAVAKSTGIDFEIVKKCRDSFAYWYQYTSRHSGPDLIFNHLTMQIFNHVAIFDHEYWPKQVVVNGMVMYEGEKMSKSLGNIIPLSDAIDKVGVDPLRIVELTSADLFSDSEYSESAINGIRERLDYLNDIVEKIEEYESGELTHIDYWLYSKLNRKIEAVTAAMESLELREYSTQALYNSIIELRKYFERGGKNGMVIKEYLQNLVLLLQPVAPHISEEFWHRLGNETFVSKEKWPNAEKEMINDTIEEGEELVALLLEDVKKAAELVGKKNESKKIRSITLVVADEWKRGAINQLAQTKNTGTVIAKLRDEGVSAEIAAKYVGKLAKEMNRLSQVKISEDEEYKLLTESKDYFGNALGAQIIVEREKESKSARADRAAPLKPSIEIMF
ncbi:MAG: leucine--tRNA ligase [Candidatus Micrarchaeota archaeon]|nr:leucine--tRNA ligase [Candidatus Micrarchaeota archaeon]